MSAHISLMFILYDGVVASLLTVGHKKMRLTIFIDARALVYPGREMDFLLLPTLQNHFSVHFPDL